MIMIISVVLFGILLVDFLLLLLLCTVMNYLKKTGGKPHKTEGNKSTNGFGLNKDGIDKMKKGWLCILDDPDYTNAFNFQFRENGVVMKPVVNRWQREIELW